jgi:hypothetical protein
MPAIAGVTAAELTQTEDCMLALIGGWRVVSSKLTFTPADLGQGPVSFNADPTVAKRFNAYLEYRPAEFSPPGKKLSEVDDLGMSYAKDSAAPEFMDSYPTPRPIIYLRPNPGGAVGASGDLTKVIYHGKNGFKSDNHYDFDQLLPYSNMSGPTPPVKKELSDFQALKASDTDLKPIQPYFATGLTAKFAGTYMLIAPGSDRVYGNTDDIVMGAGGGQ